MSENLLQLRANFFPHFFQQRGECHFALVLKKAVGPVLLEGKVRHGLEGEGGERRGEGKGEIGKKD
jgi:hypothetical protein